MTNHSFSDLGYLKVQVYANKSRTLEVEAETIIQEILIASTGMKRLWTIWSPVYKDAPPKMVATEVVGDSFFKNNTLPCRIQ